MKGVTAMQITKRTVASTVINLIALLNSIMIMIGKPVLSISDNDVGVVVSVVFTICAWAYGFWKNNSFTKEAIQADEYLELLRSNETLEDGALYYEDDDDEDLEEIEDEDISEGDQAD